MIIALAVVASAYSIKRVCLPLYSCGEHATPVGDRRNALVQAFTRELIGKTPGLGCHQEIKRVEIQAITLQNETLVIVPRVWWSGQESFTEFPCTLHSDGFGGFVGQYSPISDNTKNIWVSLK